MTVKLIWVCVLLIIYPLGCLMVFGAIYGYSARKSTPGFNRKNIKNIKGIVSDIIENDHPRLKKYTLTIPYEIDGQPRQGQVLTSKKYNKGDKILFAYDCKNPENFERIRTGIECYPNDAILYPGLILFLGIVFLSGTALIIFTKIL